MRARRRFLTRISVLAAVCCVGVAVPAVALADPVGPECSDEADDCEIGVEVPGGDGGQDEGSGSDGWAPGDGGNEPPAGVFTDCASTIVETDAKTHPIAGDRPPGDQVLAVETCTSADGDSIKRVEWVAATDGVVDIDPAVLAQQAVDRLVLPQPVMNASPESTQIVNLPVWLAVTAGSWQAQTAEATLPGWVATATATPIEADWDMGDGTTVTCTDRGAEWTTDVDPKAESECGHTYLQPSESGLDVSVTVVWRIDWTVTGPDGTTSDTAPELTTTSTDIWPVTESHALNTE